MGEVVTTYGTGFAFAFTFGFDVFFFIVVRRPARGEPARLLSGQRWGEGDYSGGPVRLMMACMVPLATSFQVTLRVSSLIGLPLMLVGSAPLTGSS